MFSRFLPCVRSFYVQSTSTKFTRQFSSLPYFLPSSHRQMMEEERRKEEDRRRRNDDGGSDNIAINNPLVYNQLNNPVAYPQFYQNVFDDSMDSSGNYSSDCGDGGNSGND